MDLLVMGPANHADLTAMNTVLRELILQITPELAASLGAERGEAILPYRWERGRWVLSNSESETPTWVSTVLRDNLPYSVALDSVLFHLRRKIGVREMELLSEITGVKVTTPWVGITRSVHGRIATTVDACMEFHPGDLEVNLTDEQLGRIQARIPELRFLTCDLQAMTLQPA